MRKILFRGKTENGEWAEGNLLLYPDVNRAYIQKGDYFKGGAIEVKRSTVGQYSGLNDENGKGIFEGDIVQYYERQFDGKDSPICDVVVYTEGGFAVRAYFLNNWLFDSVHGNIQLRDVEVIGNIHDNPELLKGGDG